MKTLLFRKLRWSFSIFDVIRITFEMNLWMQRQIRKNAPTTPVYDRQLATFAQITFSLHLTFFPSFEMANHFKGFRPDQMKRVRYHLHLFFFTIKEMVNCVRLEAQKIERSSDLVSRLLMVRAISCFNELQNQNTNFFDTSFLMCDKLVHDLLLESWSFWVFRSKGIQGVNWNRKISQQDRKQG